MRAVLARYYGWSPEVIEKLTPRQARGWFNRIPIVNEMFGGGQGEASTGEQDWDLNDIFDEADDLGIPNPRGNV